MNLLKKIFPQQAALAPAAEEMLAGIPPAIATARVMVPASVATATQAPPDVSAAVAAAVAAERQRIADIEKAAGDGQEKLAIELMVSGKSKMEALEAINAALRAAPAPQPAPQVTAKEVAAEVLNELRAGAPPVPSTSEQSGEPNVYDKFISISDPVEAQKFFAAHQAEIESIQRTRNNQKKEG